MEEQQEEEEEEAAAAAAAAAALAEATFRDSPTVSWMEHMALLPTRRLRYRQPHLPPRSHRRRPLRHQ